MHKYEIIEKASALRGDRRRKDYIKYSFSVMDFFHRTSEKASPLD
jgi:hypothetical protein